MTISRAHALTVLSVTAVLAVAGATPAQSASRPKLVDYTHGATMVGVAIHSTADATAELRGAPASFKQFAGTTADHLTATSSCAGKGYVGITVDRVRSDGFAVGGVSDCGGYAALWAVVDGSWKQIAGTQDTWDCRVLRRRHVPSDIAGDSCYAYHGDHREHAYHQA